MNEPRRRDDAIDRELSRALRAQTGTAAHGPHLDAEGAAAWFERRLDAAVSSSYEAHLAACPDCQALVAALARITPEPEEGGTGRSWLRLPWLVPAAATAAAAIVIWAVLPPRAPAPQLENTQARTEAPVDRTEPARESAAAEPESAAAPKTANNQSATLASRGNAAPAPAPPSLARERRDAATFATPPPPPPGDAPPGVAGAAAADARATAAPPLADAQAARKVAVAAETPASAPLAAPPVERQERAAADALPRALNESAALSAARRAGTLNVVAADGRGRWRRAGAIVEFAPGPAAPFAVTALPVGADTLAAGSSPGGSVSWFVGAAGAVLVTTDGMRFVRVTAPAVVDLVSVVATDARSAVVTAADGRRFRTTDQGATWSAVP